MHNAGTAVKRVSLAWEEPHSWSQIQQTLARLLQCCQRSLAQQNSNWLGHCKAMVQAGNDAAYGSIAGADEPLLWRGMLREPASEAIVTLYCVVYAMPDDLVETVVQGTIKTCLPDAVEVPTPQQQQTNRLELI